VADVSVIVPAYNSARELRECLSALVRSTTSALEIIVVDDASTDDTLFGSYDRHPRAPGLVSQYRNLLHHYTHQVGHPDASTLGRLCRCRSLVHAPAVQPSRAVIGAAPPAVHGDCGTAMRFSRSQLERQSDVAEAEAAVGSPWASPAGSGSCWRRSSSS
jgi:hypothetical protein